MTAALLASVNFSRARHERERRVACEVIGNEGGPCRRPRGSYRIDRGDGERRHGHWRRGAGDDCARRSVLL